MGGLRRTQPVTDRDDNRWKPIGDAIELVALLAFVAFLVWIYR